MAGKSEFHTSKETAVHWFRKLKAFDVIDENKSYAQALLSNLHQKIQKSEQNSRVPRKSSMLQSNVSDTSNARFQVKRQLTYQQVNPQNAYKRQVSVADCKNYKNCQNIGSYDGVTEATETMKPLHLTNRFQPLLHIPMDDVDCVA